MPTASSDSGDMSQDSAEGRAHRSAVDPAARKGKTLYHGLQSSSVGLEMGLSVLIGVVIGVALDNVFDTSPVFMLVWIGFGLVAGFRGVLRAVAKEDKRAARELGNG